MGPSRRPEGRRCVCQWRRVCFVPWRLAVSTRRTGTLAGMRCQLRRTSRRAALHIGGILLEFDGRCAEIERERHIAYRVRFKAIAVPVGTGGRRHKTAHILLTWMSAGSYRVGIRARTDERGWNLSCRLALSPDDFTLTSDRRRKTRTPLRRELRRDLRLAPRQEAHRRRWPSAART